MRLPTSEFKAPVQSATVVGLEHGLHDVERLVGLIVNQRLLTPKFKVPVQSAVVIGLEHGLHDVEQLIGALAQVGEHKPAGHIHSKVVICMCVNHSIG